MEMVSLYTETLDDLLKNLGYGTDNQNQSLTDILEKMDKFPSFVFGEEISLSMKELFLEKFDIREIGAETEEMFLHFWNERTNELLINYVPKIQMWLDHFNDLFKFTVKLEYSENLGFTNNRTNTYYLNPVSVNTDDLKSQDVETYGDTGRKNRSYNKDVLQSVWGKTRAQLLKQIFELQNIYSECLEAFSTIFMGVL